MKERKRGKKRERARESETRTRSEKNARETAGMKHVRELEPDRLMGPPIRDSIESKAQ